MDTPYPTTPPTPPIPPEGRWSGDPEPTPGWFKRNWVTVAVGAVALVVGTAIGAGSPEEPETVIEEIEVPGDTIVKEVEVPGDTIVKEVEVPGDTVVKEVEVEVVREVVPQACLDAINSANEILEISGDFAGISAENSELAVRALSATEDYFTSPAGSYTESAALQEMTDVTVEMAANNDEVDRLGDRMGRNDFPSQSLSCKSAG